MGGNLITLIIGLPGSGKTHYGEKLAKERSAFFIDDISDYDDLCSALLYFNHVIISDPNLCDPNVEKAAVNSLKENEIEKIYFENNPEACKANIDRRSQVGDERRVKDFIDMYSEIYNPPEDARSVWQPQEV